MDKFVARFHAEPDRDLAVCWRHGCAYQADMGRSVEYGREYLEKYQGYEGTPIAQRITAARVGLVNRHYQGPVLDIGIGSGEFLRAIGDESAGFDINPFAVEMLRTSGRFSDEFSSFGALTFWDSLEHVAEPEFYLSRVSRGAYLFAAIPVFTDVGRVRESRHYRPGEHFYYWTPRGFVNWMALYGFRLIEQNDDETDAGRDSIGSFAFVKDLA